MNEMRGEKVFWKVYDPCVRNNDIVIYESVNDDGFLRYRLDRSNNLWQLPILALAEAYDRSNMPANSAIDAVGRILGTVDYKA